MSEQDDRTFLKRFSALIVGLAIFAAVIIVFSIELGGKIEPADNPAHQAAVEERIEPVFGVYAGDTGRAAAQQAAQKTDQQAASSTQQQAAFGGSTDGEQIYNSVCQACHQAGAAGAPQLVAEQWQDRLKKGEDALVSSAINGLGAMPPKGGRSDLTDEQVRAAVEYMLEQVRG